jgi:hypothetical protein
VAAAPPARAFRYELSFDASGAVALELRVNGAVVLDESEANTQYGGRRISHWVRAGRNTVRVRVLPAEAIAVAGAPQLEIEVQKVLPKERKVESVAKLSWPGDERVSLPAEIEIEFTVDADVPGCQLFAQAEPLDDGPQTRRAVAAFAREVHRAYAQRNGARLGALRRYYADEHDRCYGRVPSSPDTDAKAFAKHVQEQQRWEITPLTADDLQLERLPDGRTYRATRNGDPLVEVQLEGSKLSADVYVARIEGQLTWVR